MTVLGRRALGQALVVAASVLGVVATAAPASAQPRRPPAADTAKNAEAKKLFDKGYESYSLGDYESAIEAWLQAHEISKKALIFESIANAYERLGQPKKAREYLGKWRDVAPRDEHALLDSRLQKLDQRIARDEQAESARKAQEDRVRAEVEARASAAQRQQQRRATAPTTSVPGLILAGAGAGAVVVGLTLDLIASGRRPNEEESCVASGDRQLCTAAARDGIESSNTLATAGDVIWLAGAAAVTAGVVLIVLYEPDAAAGAEAPRAATSRTRIAPVMTPGGGAAFSLRHEF